MSIEKNGEYIVDIIDNGFEGEGIAKIEGMTIFIPNTIKGELAKVLIVKVNKNFAYGKLIELLKVSKDRNVNIDCNTYKRCGGCDLRHMNYEATLKLKREIVANILKKNLKSDVEVEPVIGMEDSMYYRNKLQYPVGMLNGEAVMGVYANRSHSIIPTTLCFIQDKTSQEVANDIFEFIKKSGIQPYDESNGKGTIRHIIIKIGKKTGEIMVVLVINGNELKKEEELVKYITSKYDKVRAIVKNINRENTNVILGKENVVLYGEGYIQDVLGEYKFNISAMAFYQVNPVQTEKLYNTAIKLANLSKSDIVYDLYCGIGTISIFLSKNVKKVYGIEIVPEAIEDAKQNAKINNITNVEFTAGDVEEVLPIIMKKEMPNVVFVDPPRKGLDDTTIQNLLKIRSEKIVYISCNPATLARDLNRLEEEYEIVHVQPVDMFPWSKHVECITIMRLKEK